MKAAASSSLLDKPSHGISIFTATLFVVGEVAGSGVLALPEAIKFTGWFGLIIMLLVCSGAAYSGVLLGRSWMHLEDNIDSSLKLTKTRNPYALIGFHAWGSFGRSVSIITLVIQLYGGSIVSLLLAAEMAQSLLTQLFPSLLGSITFCEWIVIIAIVLLPFSFFGSPVDFWPVAFFAMSSTAVASVLIVIACITEDVKLNFQENVEESSSNKITIASVLLGIGTMNFGFSGASAMPTIQNDMRNKRKFGVAVILAYVILAMIYLPVSVVGYHVFGNNVKSNVVRNITPSLIVTWIQIMIAIHVVCSYLILLNPVNLNVEEYLGIKHSFNLKRCISRVFIALIATLIGLTVPKFGKILNLVGASAVTMQCFILPCTFYYFLYQNTISKKVKILLISIIFAGIAVAISSSISALSDLFDPEAFTVPCFIQNCYRLD